MTTDEILERIHAELVLIRKAASAKSGRPNLITIRAVVSGGGGWDFTKTIEEVIDANKITQIKPFLFWNGDDHGNVPGAFIHLGRDHGIHVLMTPAEVKALAEK